MKMPEKYDLSLMLARGKGTRHRGNPCVFCDIPSRYKDIMAVRLQNSNHATDGAITA